MNRLYMVLCALFWIIGCAELPGVSTLRCGNGLVEQQVDEDCDGLPADSPYACGRIGGADACRFVCAETPCPTGWACGNDAICRASTGVFSRGGIAQLPGDALALGDMDGDGSIDAITQAQGKLHVIYGTPDGKFEGLYTVGIPAIQADLTVADTNDDGVDDAAFFSDNSLTILEGRRARTLVPAHIPEADAALNPSQIISFSARSDESQEVLTLQADGDVLLMGLAGRALDDAGGIVEALGGGLEPVSPTIVQLDDDPNDEIGLARIGGQTVVIFSVDCPDDPALACTTTRLQRIETPAGWTVSRNPVQFGDLDRDGLPELVVPLAAEDGAREIAVAAGGEDGFGPLEIRLELTGAAGCAPSCPGSLADFSMLQRLGDVIGDERPDFITGTGVYELVGDEALELVQRLALTEPLNMIDPIDVDGDGNLDVVGNGAGEVIFHLSDGSRFTEVSTTTGSGFRPSMGDFDGDGRIDMAVVDRSGQVTIAFNGPSGLPTEQVVVGNFAPPVRLTVSQRRFPTALGLDRPDELAIIADGELTILYGDSGRLPASFIGLLPAAGNRTPPPIQLLIGQFDDGPLSAFALMAGRGDDLNPFAAPLDALTTRAFLPTQPAEGCTNFEPVGFSGHTVDWDGDGIDEILQVEDQRGRVVMPNRWNVQAAGLDTGALRCTWNVTVETNNGPASLLSSDLDQNGLTDVLLLFSPEQAPAPLTASTVPAYMALWLDAEDGNTEGTQHVVQPDATAATLVDVGGVRTVMTFGNGRAWSLTWNGADFDVFDRFAVPQDVRDARTADVDGDGIEDLLVKTGSGLIVYRQASCSAREAWLGSCARPPTVVAP